MTRSLVGLVVVLSSSLSFAQSLPETAQRLASAQQAYRGCQNGKLQLEFAPVLQRLEASRRSLEKGRRAFESARRSLEVTRQRIEAAHQHRHASKAERDAKEAQYLQSLEAQYTQPMAALRPLLTGYTDGVNRYAEVFERTAAFCAGPGITTASARSFVTGLEQSVASLEGGSKQFVAGIDAWGTRDLAAR